MPTPSLNDIRTLQSALSFAQSAGILDALPALCASPDTVNDFCDGVDALLRGIESKPLFSVAIRRVSRLETVQRVYFHAASEEEARKFDFDAHDDHITRYGPVVVVQDTPENVEQDSNVLLEDPPQETGL